MYGAILGDLIGSPFEFLDDRPEQKFQLFNKETGWSDDTVLTIAIADALMSFDTIHGVRKRKIKSVVKEKLLTWGFDKYPHPQNGGYGRNFAKFMLAEKYNYSWLKRQKYKYSKGNGSAMRISAVAYLYDDLKVVERIAGLTAQVTHNSKEGRRAAKSTAAAIYLARTGVQKPEIKEYLQRKYHYQIKCRLVESKTHVELAKDTVEEAFQVFFASENLEETVRNAVLYTSDTDTCAAIAGSIAEAYYGGIEPELKEKIRGYLKPDMLDVLDRFDRLLQKNKE